MVFTTIVMELRESTSIKINPKIWKQFKIIAAFLDKDISVLLEEVISEKISQYKESKLLA